VRIKADESRRLIPDFAALQPGCKTGLSAAHCPPGFKPVTGPVRRKKVTATCDGLEERNIQGFLGIIAGAS